MKLSSQTITLDKMAESYSLDIYKSRDTSSITTNSPKDLESLYHIN